MTFEEVKAKIDSGGCASLEEISGMLRFLSDNQRLGSVYVALALFESRKLFKGPRWSFWAAKEYSLTDDKDALHRANVGEMLRSVEAADPKRHARLMALGISHLMIWAKLFNAGKILVETKKTDRPLIPFFNFLKENPDAFSWKREALDRAVRIFLDPEVEFEQPELALTFDAVGALLDDDDLARITGKEEFDGRRAFIMANNGAKLCAHAVAVIVKDYDSIPAASLEEIERKLDEAHRKLKTMLIQRNQEA